MREQLRPIERFLRWYCQPPDFVRAAAVVPPALRLPLARAVVGLAALYALGLALHLPSALLSASGVGVGCSVTLARGWTEVMHGATMMPHASHRRQQGSQDMPHAVTCADDRTPDISEHELARHDAPVGIMGGHRHE